MILTILLVMLTVIFIILAIKISLKGRNDLLELIFSLIGAPLTIVLLVVICVEIAVNSFIENKNEEIDYQYNNLVTAVEEGYYINVMDGIAEYNNNVIIANNYCDNIWFGWMICPAYKDRPLIDISEILSSED